MNDIVYTIHDNLPREAPGSAACTRRALASITPFSSNARVLDVGCGPGAQTVDLASALGGRIVAMDLHAPYLLELNRRTTAAGTRDRVAAVRATMQRMPFGDEAFDLIWSEGAIYNVGFERGLVDWRRLLRRRGWVAITELCWLVDAPSAAARAFWSRGYPAMTTVARNLAIAAASGYEAVDAFPLPESAWWDEYYGPLERRLAVLRAERSGAADRAAIESVQEQIDLYRLHSASYGYVFFVLRGC